MGGEEDSFWYIEFLRFGRGFGMNTARQPLEIYEQAGGLTMEQ